MPTVNLKNKISEEEYLKGELAADFKHEFVDGQVFAMAGASKNHERISLNISSLLNIGLKDSPCEPFGSDIKVRTPTGNYRYPDCMVVCDDDTENEYYTENPTILVEVISRSTRKIDEQIKRMEYINIPSLKEYALIEQDFVDVTVYRKSDQWRPTHYFLGDDILFESIELTLSVEEVYHRVVNQDMAEFLEVQKTE